MCMVMAKYLIDDFMMTAYGWNRISRADYESRPGPSLFAQRRRLFVDGLIGICVYGLAEWSVYAVPVSVVDCRLDHRD